MRKSRFILKKRITAFGMAFILVMNLSVGTLIDKQIAIAEPADETIVEQESMQDGLDQDEANNEAIDQEPTITVESNLSADAAFYEKVLYKPIVSGDGSYTIKVCGNRKYLASDGTVCEESISHVIEDGKDTVTFEETGSYEVWTVVTDASNVEKKSETTNFCVDVDAPSIKVTGVAEGVTYQDKAEISVVVTDWNRSDKDTNYEVIVKRDDKVQDIVTEWKYDTYQAMLKSPIVLTQQGSYFVKITAKDAAGRQDSKAYTFAIKHSDIKARVLVKGKNNQTAPVEKIESIFAGETESTVQYYKSDVSFDVEVNNPDFAGTKVYLGASVNGTAATQKAFEMNASQNQFGEEYSEEGRYKVFAYVEDIYGNVVGKQADGNQMDPAYVRCFVIDKTAPVFKVEEKATRLSDGAQGKVLTITAKEKNPELESYNIQVDWIGNDGGVSTRNIQGKKDWKIEDEKQMYELALADEGKYIITLTGNDIAGNAGHNGENQIATYTTYVDHTVPVIQINSVKNGAYYNHDVVLDVQVEEQDYENSNAFISIVRRYGQDEEKIEEQLPLTDVLSKFAYTCQKDGEYTVVVTAEDTSRMEQKKVLHFVIDQTKPEFSIEGVVNGYKTNQAVSFDVRAIDDNHDLDQYTITVIRSDVDGELETIQAGFEYVTEEDNPTMIQKTISLTEEGKYEVIVRGADKAGNEGEEKSCVFYIDKTAPQIYGVVFMDGKDIINEVYGNIYGNKVIRVEFSLVDQVVGVDDKKVYVTMGTAKERTQATKTFVARHIADEKYCVFIPADLGVAQLNCPITIWANDKIGNESSYTSSNIIYNTSKPSIKMESETDYTKWTNKNITFHTTVTDEKSGIREILYKIDNKVVKKVSFHESVTSYDYDLVVKKNAEKVTGYNVCVEVTNNCGTTNKMKKTVYVDKQKPQVTLSGIESGKHYNKDQSFTTTVKDVSYKKTKTTYVVRKILDGKKSTVSLAAFRPGDYEDSCKRTLVMEGEYEIYAVVRDAAGNKSKSNTLRFVIDKTAPKLTISGAPMDGVSASSVNVTFTCEESFYQTNNVSVDIERTIDGKTEKQKIEKFPKNGKSSSMIQTFDQDGTYQIQMQAVDQAGNKSITQMIRFIVDQTKPIIRISGTDNYQKWAEPLTVQFAVEESNYAKNQVYIHGTKTDIDGNVTDVELPQFASSGKNSSISQEFFDDGIYWFEVSAKDAAGNQESQQINFVVDRTRPKIEGVKQFNGGYYQQFVLTDSLEKIVKDLTVVSYRILLNGIEYDGVSSIDKEGKYTLSMDVTDEMGFVASETIEFVIDHTAPKVVFSGVADHGVVHEAGKVLLSLTNVEDEITDVRMNGIHYGKDTRDLAYNDYGSYNIEVDCIDQAGNKATRNISFVYSNPYKEIVLFGLLGIAIVIGCVYVCMQTRKKKGTQNK